MLTLADIDVDAVATVLAHYGLALRQVADDLDIPGSYWGAPEAGIIGEKVYVRNDTPLHSLLHEACHLIVAPAEKRPAIHTNASDSQAEEEAACYLQIVLADSLPGASAAQLMHDMDLWGYSFRLGSTRAWFEHDAAEARTWLAQRGLLKNLPHATVCLPVPHGTNTNR